MALLCCLACCIPFPCFAVLKCKQAGLTYRESLGYHSMGHCVVKHCVCCLDIDSGPFGRTSSFDMLGTVGICCLSGTEGEACSS